MYNVISSLYEKMTMNQESGKGMIKAFILLLIMIIMIVGICMSISKNIKTQKVDTVVSNMLTIKSKCKVFNENRIRTNKGEEDLIGTKLSDVGKNEEEKQEQDSNENDENSENTEDNPSNENTENNEEKNDKKDELTTIIDEFKKVGVIAEDEYEKYYVLTDKNLEDLKIKVKNEKQSYYLVNYETNEVIITKGYEGKYKISEIEKIGDDAENKENDNEENADESKE